VTYWQRWLRQPRTTWLRKAVFQIHLWTGIGLGLYVLFISVTGSVLVFSNELYTAATEPRSIRLVSRLIDLHDNLLGGEIGRRINGLAAILVVAMAVTGIVVWWPGMAAWRRSLIVKRNVGWRRLAWDLHNAIGFWSLGFILIFGLSGIYLGNPQPFQDFADRIAPPTPGSEPPLIDKAIYWLAYLHFGRVNGIGIPCRGPGVCDIATKTVWALFGLAPAAMFVTGAVMWWNRVVRRKARGNP
jgi:uncharacterized iron-regulated membrane protein